MEKLTDKTSLFLNLLKNKKYDEIYEEFGQEAYVLFADFKHKRQDIKELVRKEDYAGLYKKYGENELFTQLIYKKHIKKLLKDKKYIDICSIYGEKKYYKYQYKMYKSDVLFETNSKLKANIYTIKRKIITATASAALIAAFSAGVLGSTVEILRDVSYKSAIAANQEVYDKYNDRINEYADYINSLNLDNDLEIVMKVMNDMWNEIDGYGNPEVDYSVIPRLAFAEENGAGVCRHLADDFSARLNAINPKYQASTIAVYMDDSQYLNGSTANIVRRYASTYQPSEGNETVDENNDFYDEYVGNHLVSTFKPLGKNYTLVVDPTNPSIGIIANGKIYLFSTEMGNGLEFRPVGQLFISEDKSYADRVSLFIKSLALPKSQETLDELTEFWGMDAQNQALEEIRNIDTINNYK